MGGAEEECPRCASLQRRAPQLVARAVQKGLARPAASLLAAAVMEAILAGAALHFKRTLHGLGGALPPTDLLAALAVHRWAVCMAAAVLAESDRCPTSPAAAAGERRRPGGLPLGWTAGTRLHRPTARCGSRPAGGRPVLELQKHPPAGLHGVLTRAARPGGTEGCWGRGQSFSPGNIARFSR